MTTVSAGPPATGSITDADFERFRDFFYRHTGIYFSTSKRYFVDHRLQACIEASGQRSFAAWFAALRMDQNPDHLQRLVNKLTVNETYFMREDYQFDCLLRSVLPAIMSDREDHGRTDVPVRILSLPCSTGEEAYSVALRLLEEWPPMDTVDVEIHGADIDTAALTQARAGKYGVRSLQRVPRSWLATYFTPSGEGAFQVNDEIRDAIEFSKINVCDAVQMMRYRAFDVIFCRNLLIYFDEMSSRRAVENLYAALRPGGFLFLGHAESMSSISSIFEPRRFAHGLVYRRPTSGGMP